MRTTALTTKKEKLNKSTKDTAKTVVSKDKYLTADELLDRIIPRVEALFDKK